MSSQSMILNKQALFCDETENYRIPVEPEAFDQVVLRFRTAKDNVDMVYLVLEQTEIEMSKVDSDEWFDYYSTHIKIKDEPVHYHFEVVQGSLHYSYDKLGAVNNSGEATRFCINPGFKTPGWAKGAVMYQIFVDRFYNGDSANDPVDDEYFYVDGGIKKVQDWYSVPKEMDVNRFYGGDLQGVMDKLDYLKYLGIEAIYFNPLFVSPSNHKYDIQDYDYIDPHFGVIIKDEGEPLPAGEKDNRKAGKYISRVSAKENLEASNQLFIRLVQEAHKRGIKVILDGVFNHCGSFNKWLDREGIYEGQEGYEPGAYVAGSSPYTDYFNFHSENWPYNDSYDGWWGYETLPKLNYEGSEALYKKILEIGAKWVSPPYNADGWRLDVAADLGRSIKFNHQFWRDFRKTVKKANPEALILAEHYGDASSWLKGDQWDTVMNYDAFMEPVTWFLTGMEKHSDEYNPNLHGNGEAFFRAMRNHSSKMHSQSLQVAMNQLSNHDHSRFLTRTNSRVGRLATAGWESASEGINKGLFRIAVMIQMTWPGAPTLYYGDEAGVCGWTDPDSRRTYPWGREDLDLLEYHRYLIFMHKNVPALKQGSWKQLSASEYLIAYGRFYRDNKALVVINSQNEEREVRIPVWQIGVSDDECLIRIMMTEANRYNVGVIKYLCKNGYLTLKIGPCCAMLLRTED